jgi:hypothetical protein
MPQTRAALAIPFVGKDVPSPSSEFAHPDVIIGLTVLAYRYEGLRWSNFNEIVKTMKSTLGKEMGPYEQRPSAKRYAAWVALAGGALKGIRRQQSESDGKEDDATAAQVCVCVCVCVCVFVGVSKPCW